MSAKTKSRIVAIALSAATIGGCGDSGSDQQTAATPTNPPATTVGAAPSTTTVVATTIAATTTSVAAAADACAVFPVEAIDKATGLTRYTQNSKQTSGCSWRSADTRPDGGNYATGYLVTSARLFQPELDAGTYASPAKVDKLTIGTTTVLYSVIPNNGPGWQFVTFKFLGTADKAVSANVSLPQSSDPVPVVTALAQLYLTNSAKLPPAGS